MCAASGRDPANDKTRDMARSILPSRYRWTTQEQAWIRRRNRRAIGEHLRGLTGRVDADTIDRWDEEVDCRAYPDHEISRLVHARRWGGKVNHFERWAVRRTAHLPLEDRLSHIAARMPGGVIGDRAHGRLARAPEFDVTPHDGLYRYHHRALYARRRQERDEAWDRWLASLEEGLRELYEHGGQCDFNRAMKSIPTIDDPPLLRSIAGLAKVVRAAVSRPETREVLVEEVRRYRPTTAGRPDP